MKRTPFARAALALVATAAIGAAGVAPASAAAPAPAAPAAHVEATARPNACYRYGSSTICVAEKNSTTMYAAAAGIRW